MPLSYRFDSSFLECRKVKFKCFFEVLLRLGEGLADGVHSQGRTCYCVRTVLFLNHFGLDIPELNRHLLNKLQT